MRLELFRPMKPMQVLRGFAPGHNGIDFKAEWGQPVRAATDGTAYICFDNDRGYGVVVRTDEARSLGFGGMPRPVHTVYWHLQTDIPIKAGQKVKCGDIIGYAGNTGLVFPKPTPQDPHAGTHLHFGVKPEYPGEDPWSWADDKDVTGYRGCIDPGPYLSLTHAEDFGNWQRTLHWMQALLDAIRGQRKPAVTPPPSPAAPAPLIGTSHALRVKECALAIQKREGYFAPGEDPRYPDGSVSWRNKNPGNVKLTPYTKTLGAIGADDQGHAIFPDSEIGFSALCQFITDAANNQLRAYHDATFQSFFARYAEFSNGYAEEVSSAVGASPDDPITVLLI